MFTSASLNPFRPHLISSFSLNASPLVSETNTFSFPSNTSTNDHFYDPLNNMALPPPPQRAPPPPSHSMVSNYVDNQHNPSASSSTFLIQSCKTGSSKPVKKDRHSKICTAQGLRDRRVRLSIGIARKFFDLQDMLGFDKASKTLEWLLNKSKKAIKEVQEVSTNNNNGSSSSTTTVANSSTCEVVSEKNGDVFSKLGGEKKLQRSPSLNFSVHMAKESRAKARERARERTRVKMYTKRSPQSDINPHVLDQTNQTCEKLKIATYDHQLEEPNKGSNVIEESSLLVIKRKLKPNNGIVGTYQQNYAMLKDVNCSNSNNGINLMMNSPQNWDFSSAIARSSFCSITNVNPSTGLHLCGKFLEAEGNYCPN